MVSWFSSFWTLKFDMLMYPNSLWTWLHFGHRLLLSSFWWNFDLVKQIKFAVSGHFFLRIHGRNELRNLTGHIHPYPFWMKMLSVSHSMGLAAPGFVEHLLSMHLSSGSTPARPPHSMTSVFTHSDLVFQGLPFFLVPGIWKFVIDFI